MERDEFSDALFRLESLAIHADEARRRVMAADAAVIDARAEYCSAADAADAADAELQIARDSLAAAIAVNSPEPCPLPVPGTSLEEPNRPFKTAALGFEIEMADGSWSRASGTEGNYLDGGCGDAFTMEDGPIDVGIFSR